MRVCIVPEYPASLMTGGLQVQADESYRALVALGGEIEAELFDWSSRRPLADLYHFIGFPPYLHRISELVRAAGRPYVITMLFGSSPKLSNLVLARLRRLGMFHILRQRDRYVAVTGAKSIVTITQTDAAAARFIYGLESHFVKIVPHGVSESFYSCTPTAWHAEFGANPFVLSVGAIQRRKGQLLLTQICNRLKLPLVLLGPILPGEQAYAAAVGAAMRENEKFGGRWIQSLGNEDPLLLSAYGACRVFALLSAAETQPLSVMQAMAARKPILLLKASYADDPLFAGLLQAPSAQPEAVAGALQQAWHKGGSSYLTDDYKWSNVARRLQAIYESAFSNSFGLSNENPLARKRWK